MTLRSKGQRAGDMRGSACRYHWTFSSFHWQNLLIIFSCGSDFYYTLSSAAWSSVEIGHQCTGQSVCLYFLPLSLTTSAWYNSFVFLLTLLAWYAEQGLWNGQASVCLSVCPIDRQQHRWPTGLLQSALLSWDIDRQRRAPALRTSCRCPQHAATAPQPALTANASSVTLTADVRRWT